MNPNNRMFRFVPIYGTRDADCRLWIRIRRVLLELEFAENIFSSSSQNPFSTSDKKTVVAGQCWVKLWKIAIRKHGHAFVPTRVMFWGFFFVVFLVVLRVAVGGRKNEKTCIS